MRQLSVLRHPLLFAGVTLPEFVRWYFLVEPIRILKSYAAYLKAFVEIFSFVFLLKTLISPWKQIADRYPDKGLNLGKIAETMTMNMVSRTIGFLFRIFTIVMGMLAVSLLTIGFAAYLIGWLLFPVLFWIGLSYFLTAFLKIF